MSNSRKPIIALSGEAKEACDTCKLPVKNLVRFLHLGTIWQIDTFKQNAVVMATDKHLQWHTAKLLLMYGRISYNRGTTFLYFSEIKHISLPLLAVTHPVICKVHVTYSILRQCFTSKFFCAILFIDLVCTTCPAEWDGQILCSRYSNSRSVI